MTDYPPDSPVLLVGAVDRDDRVAPFSTRVRGDAVLAPGVEIVSTWCRPAGADVCEPGVHTYGMAEGTSFAAPHVAGALALLRSAGYGPHEAVERLRATAVEVGPAGAGDANGHGRIDVGAAIMEELSFGDTFAAEPPPVGAAAPGPAADGAASAVDAPAPTPARTEAPDPVDGEVRVDEPAVQALPDETLTGAPSGLSADTLVHLVAAVILGVSLASWSAVARRHG
jgi:subtilisin family serine protease